MADISRMIFPDTFFWIKGLYFGKNFTEVCPLWYYWWYFYIGLDNGWAPNRRQAIIWINADPKHGRIYAALGEMSLVHVFIGQISDISEVVNDPTMVWSTSGAWYRDVKSRDENFWIYKSPR